MRLYSVTFKQKVIKLAEEKGKHYAAKTYCVDQKRVCEWCQQKDQLNKLPKKRQRLEGTRRPLKYADIDIKLWNG